MAGTATSSRVPAMAAFSWSLQTPPSCSARAISATVHSGSLSTSRPSMSHRTAASGTRPRLGGSGLDLGDVQAVGQVDDQAVRRGLVARPGTEALGQGGAKHPAAVPPGVEVADPVD